jgi:hypothetical protein
VPTSRESNFCFCTITATVNFLNTNVPILSVGSCGGGEVVREVVSGGDERRW